jgi:hypothetical protein
MALRARVPALVGSLSSTFWVKKASGMDEAPMPAAPPTAQPRADATSCIDAEASKGMRMAQAKAIVFGNARFRILSNPCQRNRRLSTTPCRAQSTPKEGCSGRKKSSNSWQGQQDQVVLSSVQCFSHRRIWTRRKSRVGKDRIRIKRSVYINTVNTRIYGAVLKWTVFLWNVFLTAGGVPKV